MQDAGPRLLFRWRETEVPNDGKQIDGGFGSHLIRQVVPFMPGGSAQLEHTPDGLRCVLGLPIEDGETEQYVRTGRQCAFWVEDEFLIAMELQETLERLGIEVVGPVRRLGEAIASAASEHLDGAPLYVNLSTGTSAAIAKTLQARGIPFVFITGYEHNTLSGDLDSTPRLVKPLDEGRLRGALERFASAR